MECKIQMTIKINNTEKKKILEVTETMIEDM